MGVKGGPPASSTPVLSLCSVFWWRSARATRLQAVAWMVAILAQMIGRSRVSLWASRMRGRQLEALAAVAHSRGSRRDVLVTLLKYVLASTLQTPLQKLGLRLRRALRHQWVTHLTRYFLENYIEAQCLQLGLPPGSADPMALPDQRISDDVDKFVNLVLSLSLDALQGAIHVYTFGRELLSISRELTLAAVLGAASITAATLGLGRRLSLLYADERRTAGEFTYVLTRIRENAESISFYGGQRQEVLGAEAKLDARQLAEWKRFGLRDVVESVRNSCHTALCALPAVVLSGGQPARHEHHDDDHGHDHGHGHGHGHGHAHGPGHGDSFEIGPSGGASAVGLVSRASEAFEDVLEHFSIVAQNINDFSRLTAVAYDLHSYQRNAVEVASQACGPGHGFFVVEDTAGQAGQGDEAEIPKKAVAEAGSRRNDGTSWLYAKELTLLLPNGRPLLRSVSFEAPAVGGLLITGPSGVGKTSLLRAVAGLWTHGTGSVVRRAGTDDVMFLPQRPYMALGSLRQQLLYPRGGAQTATLDDKTLAAALEGVGLGAVLQRCGGSLDEERRWTEELSLGEQQRVGFARVLVHKPRYVLLDEATSACDVAIEADLYKCVSSTCTAWVSVGHRSSLAPFHRLQLKLRTDLSNEIIALEQQCDPAH